MRIKQISAGDKVCFALDGDGRVWVCVYESVVDEWVWYETQATPGVECSTPPDATARRRASASGYSPFDEDAA